MGFVTEFDLNKRGVCPGSHKKFASGIRFNKGKRKGNYGKLHAVPEEVSKAS